MSLDKREAVVTYDRDKVNDKAKVDKLVDRLIAAVEKAGGSRHRFNAEKAKEPVTEKSQEPAPKKSKEPRAK